MRTYGFLLVLLVSLLVNEVSAQTYIVDTPKGDSLIVNELTVIDGKDAVGVPVIKIANGDTVAVIRQSENFPDYAIIKLKGKEYALAASGLCFIDESGVEDPWNTLQMKWRTPEGRYYMTLTPYMYIICLVVGALLLGLLGLKIRPVRYLARLLVPIMIAAACYIEISAWLSLQSDMFWWCDKERYGFWGSVLRVLPFSLVLVGQITSYPIYKMLMFNKDKEKTGKTSVLPMAVSFVAAIPVIFVVLLICSIFHMGKPMQTNVGLGLLAVTAGLGTLMSLVINIKALGFIRGIWFSLFGAVYIIGAMIAVFGFGVTVWYLFIQMLITLAPWAFIFMILTSKPAEDGENVRNKGKASESLSDELERRRKNEEWRLMLKSFGKDRFFFGGKR